MGLTIWTIVTVSSSIAECEEFEPTKEQINRFSPISVSLSILEFYSYIDGIHHLGVSRKGSDSVDCTTRPIVDSGLLNTPSIQSSCDGCTPYSRQLEEDRRENDLRRIDYRFYLPDI